MSEAILALEDGFILRGKSFGASSQALGEVCFNTSMTGYQEILTDPSYKGQIVAMTYPQIGNYGVNSKDIESPVPQVSAFVIRELSPIASNWRSEKTLDEYLKEHQTPGIHQVDTRALTKHLRTQGALRGVVTTEKLSDKAAIELAKSFSYEGVDFVQQVTTQKPYVWEAEEAFKEETEHKPSHQKRLRLVAYDFGIKYNILRLLCHYGFNVQVVPAQTSAESALSYEPDAIFLSNGPGDPAVLTYAHQTVRELIGKKPIFGICLGHQIIGYALKGRTFKLKFGHRGGNQPVKDLRTGRVAITSQNHGFAVDSDSLSTQEVAVTHINLNDGTCEGLEHRSENLFSVQYHPEAAPGPHDANYFFAEFAKRVESSK